jgi:hypothetical protein
MAYLGSIDATKDTKRLTRVVVARHALHSLNNGGPTDRTRSRPTSPPPQQQWRVDQQHPEQPKEYSNELLAQDEQHPEQPKEDSNELLARQDELVVESRKLDQNRRRQYWTEPQGRMNNGGPTDRTRSRPTSLSPPPPRQQQWRVDQQHPEQPKEDSNERLARQEPKQISKDDDSKSSNPWREVTDPDSGEVFYWNDETEEMRWEL